MEKSRSRYGFRSELLEWIGLVRKRAHSLIDPLRIKLLLLPRFASRMACILVDSETQLCDLEGFSQSRGPRKGHMTDSKDWHHHRLALFCWSRLKKCCC